MGDTDEPGARIRVGDRERQATDDRLQRAHGEGRLTLAEYEERSTRAWSARTRGDLDALVVDLPPDGTTAVHAAPGATPAPSARAGGTDRDRTHRLGGLLGTVVVAGAVLWGGGQLLTSDGVSVFGSRTVAVAPDGDRVDVGVLFGSTRVVVPEGTRVVQSGITVFGSVDCAAACAGPGTREVTVDAVGAFGSVEIVTAAEAARGGLEDRDDDRGDDRDDEVG